MCVYSHSKRNGGTPSIGGAHAPKPVVEEPLFRPSGATEAEEHAVKEHVSVYVYLCVP